MKELKKTTMKTDYNNHAGCLPEGERVTIISIKKETQEVNIIDPFGRDWTIPMEYVNLN